MNNSKDTIDNICELFTNGTIKKIHYSYQISADMDDYPHFLDLVEGEGWVYLPTENGLGCKNTAPVPDLVKELFGKIPVSLLHSSARDEALHKNFYDELFGVLEELSSDGLFHCRIQRYKNPSLESKFAACADAVAT
ncbi:MAG: hypothetical protein LR008_01150 [Candidatus Pacebacteria bacterium]|nr:hypothetical protein [Candidatus Paceibacterota bacterium]